MSLSSVALDSFLDGFTFAGFFTHLRRPGSARTLFAPETSLAGAALQTVDLSQPAETPGAETHVEAALLARAQGGDSAAYEQLVRRYDRHVYSIAFRIADDADAAQKITQRVFAKAFSRLTEVHGKSHFPGWLMRLALNESIARVHRSSKDSGGDEGAVSQDAVSVGQIDASVFGRVGTGASSDETFHDQIHADFMQAVAHICGSGELKSKAKQKKEAVQAGSEKAAYGTS